MGQQDERGDSVGGGDRHEGEADHQHPGEEHHHRKASARHQDHCARSVVEMNLKCGECKVFCVNLKSL